MHRCCCLRVFWSWRTPQEDHRMAVAEQFKDWFKQRRKSLDFTQEELARDVGCSVATIRGMEQGGFRPSRQLAQIVAAALEVPTEEQAAFVQWARGTAARQELRAVGLPASAGLADPGLAAQNGHQQAGNGNAQHSTDQPPISAPLNPYKGLRAFQEADAPDFFGRDALIGRLCARLGEEGELSRFLAVVGSSGAGKSSLVRAGLIPMLRRGMLPGGANPLVVNVIPGAHPFEELEAGILRVAVNPPDSLMEQLRTDERGLTRAVNRALPEDEKSELLLVIDQFEELFTLVADEVVRADFIDSLFVAVGDPRSRLRVVITLRADYFDRPLMYLPATELLNRRSELVGPLSAGEMYRAITAPAQRVGLELESGLADAILQDVAEQPGTLPLLQYTLTELYERRTGRVLSLAAYRASGGVFGALAGRAESLYMGLSEQEQAEARQLFLRLATPGAGVEDTRRRVLRSELASAVQDEAALQRVLELFGRYRMLTFDRDPLSGGPTVEVAHEALLGTWPRLREWLVDSRERLHTERRLMLLADEWRAAGKDASFLASGTRLARFAGLAEEAGQPGALALTAEEQAYLAASLAREDQGRQEEEVRQHKELALQKRAASRLRVLVGGLALFLLVASGLSFFAFGQQRAAIDSLAHADAQRLAAEANVLLQAPGSTSPPIALLAIRSMRTQYSPQGDEILSNAATLTYPRLQLTGHTGSIRTVTFSADGKWVLTSSTDGTAGTARLWDPQTGQPGRVISYTGDLQGASFSPDGRYVLVGGADKDNTARIWDTATGQEVRQFLGHTGPVLAVAFSPDGKQVLTASVDSTARLWDAQTGKELELFAGHNALLIGVAFSPDGKQVLTSSVDGTARLWDTATGQEVRQFLGHTGPLRGAVFAPDGKTVLTGGDDSTARLWDAQTGKELELFTGHTGGVRSLAFAPDGKTVLTGGYDHTVKLWSVATGRELRTFAGHTGQVNGVAFSPDGQSFVTAGQEGIALLWSVSLPPVASSFSGHTAPVWLVSFSPDSRYVLTASDDGTARLWDAQTHAEVRQFSGLATEDRSGSASFSPDGQQVLTANDDGTAHLWDAQTGAAVTTFTVATGDIYNAAFTPDGKGVLTTDKEETLRTFRLWNAQTGQELRRFTGPEGSNTFGFSPDGAFALAATVRDPVGIWDMQAGREVRRLEGNTNSIQNAVFSLDGKYVLAGSLDNTARLWDAQTAQLVQQFVGHTAAVFGVALSPDGKQVLTGSGDTTARLWDAATGQELRRFVGHTEQVNAVAFAPNGRQIATASEDGTARLWDLDYQDTIRALCSRLVRDFTDDERAQYNISDKEPTCPQP
ncbi:MAG: helix-turn-helix domain-containing protein [Chloroflexota bacterium]